MFRLEKKYLRVVVRIEHPMGEKNEKYVEEWREMSEDEDRTRAIFDSISRVLDDRDPLSVFAMRIRGGNHVILPANKIKNASIEIQYSAFKT